MRLYYLSVININSLLVQYLNIGLIMRLSIPSKNINYNILNRVICHKVTAQQWPYSTSRHYTNVLLCVRTDNVIVRRK